MDYYTILGVAKDSSEAEIKKAYRKLALAFHPDKCSGSNTDASARSFQEISDAYAVLKSPDLRARYDNNGSSSNGTHGCSDDESKEDLYRYDSREKFESFFEDGKFKSMGFHDTEEFISQKDVHDSDASKGEGKSPKEKDGNVKDLSKRREQEVPLLCSLEELYDGVEKVIKVTRRRLSVQASNTDTDEDAMTEECKVLRVKIEPGCDAKTRKVFQREGDEGDEVKINENERDNHKGAADIVFIIKEEEHDRFQRQGHDLILKKRITLLQALTDCTIKICTLSKRTLYISCPEVIRPNCERIIKGEGMPYIQDPTRRGDLVVRFVIDFPKFLSSAAKQKLEDSGIF